MFSLITLSVVSWNCRGAWTTRVTDPSIRLAVQRSDIFAVIDPCVSLNHLSLISIPGYSLYFSLRSDTPPLSLCVHGGILLYIKSSLCSHLTVVNLNHDNNYNQVLIRIGDVSFSFVYMNQPQSTVHQRVPVPIWDNLLGKLAIDQRSNLTGDGEPLELLVVMGDFNAHTSNSRPAGSDPKYF